MNYLTYGLQLERDLSNEVDGPGAAERRLKKQSLLNKYTNDTLPKIKADICAVSASSDIHMNHATFLKAT